MSCATNNLRATVKLINTDTLEVKVENQYFDIRDTSEVFTAMSLSVLQDRVPIDSLIFMKDDREQFVELYPIVKNRLSKRYRIMGYKELNLILQNEKEKDILGCDNISCYSDIAAALNTRYVLDFETEKRFDVEYQTYKEQNSRCGKLKKIEGEGYLAYASGIVLGVLGVLGGWAALSGAGVKVNDIFELIVAGGVVVVPPIVLVVDEVRAARAADEFNENCVSKHR